MNSHSEILRDERLFVYLTGTVYSLQTVSELAISYITCSSPWAGHRNSVVASSRQSPTTLGIHSFWQFVNFKLLSKSTRFQSETCVSGYKKDKKVCLCRNHFHNVVNLSG